MFLKGLSCSTESLLLEGYYEVTCQGERQGWGQSFPLEVFPGTFGPGRTMGFSLDFLQTWYISLFYVPFNGTTLMED